MQVLEIAHAIVDVASRMRPVRELEELAAIALTSGDVREEGRLQAPHNVQQPFLTGWGELSEGVAEPLAVMLAETERIASEAARESGLKALAIE